MFSYLFVVSQVLILCTVGSSASPCESASSLLRTGHWNSGCSKCRYYFRACLWIQLEKVRESEKVWNSVGQSGIVAFKNLQHFFKVALRCIPHGIEYIEEKHE